MDDTSDSLGDVSIETDEDILRTYFDEGDVDMDERTNWEYAIGQMSTPRRLEERFNSLKQREFREYEYDSVKANPGKVYRMYENSLYGGNFWVVVERTRLSSRDSYDVRTFDTRRQASEYCNA